MEVEKVIISYGLTEAEAFAAEAALINAFRYLNTSDFEYEPLTNIVSGHNNNEAYTVQDFETIFGAQALELSEIKENSLIIKINKLYPKLCKEKRRKILNDEQIYEAVRGNWIINVKRAMKCKYVFAVYNSLIVGVYKPKYWKHCKDTPNNLPLKACYTSKLENRCYFIDPDYKTRKEEIDVKKYLYKTIININNQKAQNPISYIEIN